LATHARHLKTVAYKKMNRRNFSRLLIAAPAMAVSLSGLSTPASAVALRTQSLIKPSRLKTGDLVGLIAPGGVVDDALIEKCVKNLEAFGMRVKVSANIRAARGGYAGTVAQRVDDLHAMFLDKEVKAIWAARGGSGCIRLLPEINYSLIRNHPKILVGYSDITALLLAIYRHAGLVTGAAIRSPHH
jgi:muramoyltetrapeptide carboxypeptidase